MVVGYIEFFINQSHAKIKVLAFKKENIWVKDQDEILNIFLPNGNVFEPSFTLNNEMYREKDFIMFEETENPKAINENDDIYKIKGKVKNKLEYEIINAPNLLNDEFSVNFNYVQANFEDLPYNFYLKNSKGYYGLFKKQDDKIMSSKGTTVNFFKNLDNHTITYNDRTVIFENPVISEIQVDFSSDDQLVSWFKKELKIAAILDQTNLSKVNEFLSTLSFADDHINQSKIDRIRKILGSINFTIEELKYLVNSSEDLSSLVIDTIDKHKTEVIESQKSKIDLDLNEYRAKSKNEIDRIDSEIKVLSNQLNNDSTSERLVKIAKDLNKGLKEVTEFLKSKGIIIESKPTSLVNLESQLFLYKEFGNAKNKKISQATDDLAKLNLEIQDINKNKESLQSEVTHLSQNREAIITDIKLILDITSTPKKIDNDNNISKSYIIEEFSLPNNEQLNNDEFQYNFNQSLNKRNKTFDSRFNEFKKIIATFNCTLSSNIEVILAFLEASNNAIYTIIQVEPRWLSFKDLIDNGLAEIWESAINKPESLHFAILRDLNISSPECYAAPLIDLDRVIRNKLPYVNQPWPKNLRIIGTIQPIPEVGLPILSSTFENWGGLPDYTLTYASNNGNSLIEKKLTVDSFISWKSEDLNNYIDEYINQ